MIRPIVKYGQPVLHEPARPVESIDDGVHALIDDMVETMYVAPGIGLAAPQIGVPVRLFIVDLSVGRSANGLIVMINPQVVEREGMQTEEEGCLSVPGFNATVVRPTKVVVRGLDREGRAQTLSGEGLLARAFLHEMDHLDGTVFLDRLRGIKRDMIVRKIQKLRRTGKW